MQQSSLMRFCDECGLANDPAATHCAACQSPLTGVSNIASAPLIAPVTITPAPALAVTPGSLFSAGSQRSLVRNVGANGEFRRGTLLDGRYEIQAEIGSGGFSQVYSARELTGAQRMVAIKRIQISKLSPRQVIDATETFNREITMLARFKGVDGIPAFYEHLTDAENWYLVMQYIPGQTLEEHLRKAPGGYLTEEKTLRLGLGLAEIMQRLHALEPPVIFRDLKPANIMLTPDNKFFLIDFGIARVFTPGKLKDTTPLGSPGYAPPEQYGRAQTDQRADIYSLGATLQTMLTGRDPLELRAGESSRNPKPPSPSLRKLLDAMLAPLASERLPDMAAVQARLEGCLRAPMFWRFYRRGLLIGAFLGALGLIGSFLHTTFGFFWPYLVIWFFIWAGGTLMKGPFRRRSKRRKLSWPATALGALTIALPCLLIILWYLFGWPV